MEKQTVFLDQPFQHVIFIHSVQKETHVFHIGIRVYSCKSVFLQMLICNKKSRPRSDAARSARRLIKAWSFCFSIYVITLPKAGNFYNGGLWGISSSVVESS